MENNNPGGEQHQPRINPLDEAQQGPRRSELAREVDAAIEAARLREQSIDDLTAKRIAADIHPGSGSLHDLATTGTISEGIYAELNVAREVLPATAQPWVAALEEYCLGSGERGAAAGWTDLEDASPPDHQLIHEHITEALREQRPIDHATARAIAVQLHGGQSSALYALASSGALIDGLADELDALRDDTSNAPELWLDVLDDYLESRTDEPGPIRGWSRLWPARPAREDDEPETGEEERPPYGDRRDLRRVASGAVFEQQSDKEIPKLEKHEDCDGYAWIERLPAGWHAIPSWGVHGWDLARWPYNIVAMYDDPTAETYAFGIYTEGDITVMRCPTEAELYTSIDDLAEWYWRHGAALGPEDLPKGSGLLAHHRGPFSWARLGRWEREQERRQGC